MKGLFLISLALFATFSHTSAQDNPLLVVLDRVIEVYDLIEDFKHEMRSILSGHVTNLMGLFLNVVLGEIGQWEQRLQQQCPHLRNTEAQGEIVRVCTYVGVPLVSGYQALILNILEEMNVHSNGLSLRVSEELGNINILTDYSNFNSLFDPILDEYRTMYDEYVVRAGIEFGNLIRVTGSLPQETQACIDNGFQKLIQTC